jgi:hypothetical protein
MCRQTHILPAFAEIWSGIAPGNCRYSLQCCSLFKNVNAREALNISWLQDVIVLVFAWHKACLIWFCGESQPLLYLLDISHHLFLCGDMYENEKL